MQPIVILRALDLVTPLIASMELKAQFITLKNVFHGSHLKPRRDPKVRLALLLALPLLMLKYLCGSALIMFIHTISFIKNKVLKSVLTELLMIAFIGLNLGLIFQDNFVEENADLIWDIYCYFQNLGESIYYCITNVTLCCPYLSYKYMLPKCIDLRCH